VAISDERIAIYLQEFAEAGEAHAKALGELASLEHMRPVVKARLMHQSGLKAANQQEAYAYASMEYERHIDGLAVAREKEARAKYEVERLRTRFELLRTQESSRRTEMRNL
jgi:hypothetical protein